MMYASYLYVDDVARAYDIVLHRGVTGEVYNIGTDQEISILDVAREICALLGVSMDTGVQVKKKLEENKK